MPKISKLSIEKQTREGFPGKIVFANFLIDGIPLNNFNQIKDEDYVSCLGWGPKVFQQKQMDRLLLKVKSDFDDRNSIYICPCSDLGCGAISLKIKRSSKDENIIIWYKFGYENNLENQSNKLVNYYGIGPFYFDWEEYKETIESSLLFGEPEYWH
ncbi:oxidoreductase [Bacillus sp. AFS002410]|uniref:oxidoreductase n=1 Tax=Bacillus sp. AFS002410 TaxID=2033481 RepID=UPI000BF18E00|nr:oxidoreductase [Bacillus sp. AFS002410]PEJ59162.1 oxidoreductase [Bacillus sp. AFS002410]